MNEDNLILKKFFFCINGIGMLNIDQVWKDEAGLWESNEMRYSK